jgi:two-component system sporulation sensor kinase B
MLITSGQAVIRIMDTGKGMNEELLKRKDKGTGLGTTVSLRIIESMDGSISYKSKPGLGTETLVKIPMCGEA